MAKTTLYHHFASKDDLIVAYLEQANERFWDWFEGAVAPEHAPRAKLVALFESVAKLAASPACLGCTFQGTAAEFPAQDHPGHRAARAHKEAVLGRLRELAAQAGAREPSRLAGELLLLMDGAFAAARMFGRPAPPPRPRRPPPRCWTRISRRGVPAAGPADRHRTSSAVDSVEPSAKKRPIDRLT